MQGVGLGVLYVVQLLSMSYCGFRYAFSKNNLPTLVAIPDSSVEFGLATEMSQMDIIRLNKLYKC